MVLQVLIEVEMVVAGYLQHLLKVSYLAGQFTQAVVLR